MLFHEAHRMLIYAQKDTYLCTKTRLWGQVNCIDTLLATHHRQELKSVYVPLVCTGARIKMGSGVAWPCHSALQHQQMLSLGDLNNEKCKNKVWKINIQNFAALFNSKSIYSSASGSNPLEKGRGLICSLSSRLTERDWKLLERIQKGSEDLMQDPNFCITEKYCSGLTTIQQGSRKYSQEGRHSLYINFFIFLFFFKKGKKETKGWSGESSFILTVDRLALKKQPGYAKLFVFVIQNKIEEINTKYCEIRLYILVNTLTLIYFQ